MQWLVALVTCLAAPAPYAWTHGALTRGGPSFLAHKQPVEQLVPYSDHKSSCKASSQCPGTVSVSVEEWDKTIDEVLAAGSTRFIFAPPIKDVMSHLETDMSDKTGEPTTEEAFTVQYSGKTDKAYNIISRIPGQTDEYVLIGAHYDTVPPGGGPAPGAEDNGSGVATLLSIAQKIHALGCPLQRGIEFVLFSAEEEGLHGSTAYVADMTPEMKKNMVGAYILDEVAYTRTKDMAVVFETSGDNDKNNMLIDTLALTTNTANQGVTFEVNYHGFGSDHMPFLQAGLPAVLIIEKDNLYYADNFAHSIKDVKENLTPAFGGKVANLVGNALLNVAMGCQ